MKKVVISALVATLALSPILSDTSKAHASEKTRTPIQEAQKTGEQSEISIIKPYVFVQKDGTIALKDVPQSVYDTYNLQGLEAHFEALNKRVLNKQITIDENLNITEIGIKALAVYGSWTYHWWGYDRKFNNSQTKQYQDKLNTAAAGGTIVAGATAWWPPVAGIAGVSAGYWALLSARVGANNKGKGVYVGVTWVNAFNVKPL
ncbi:hypothetical protein ACIQWI_27075 [Peribacillus frigoritolerans]